MGQNSGNIPGVQNVFQLGSSFYVFWRFEQNLASSHSHPLGSVGSPKKSTWNMSYIFGNLTMYSFGNCNKLNPNPRSKSENWPLADFHLFSEIKKIFFFNIENYL